MARISLGRWPAILSWPKRAISVMRPAALSGFSVASSFSSSSSDSEGPHLMPMGFLMPRQYSTCAPSGWRVRSPI